MNVVTEHRVTLKRGGLILVFTAAILGATMLTLEFGTITNASTAAFSFLILVLLSAFFGDVVVAIAASAVATLCFNYFYLPPVGTFYIAAFSDWISLSAFLLTAVTISHLASSAAENTGKANVLDNTMKGLKELGAWLLSMPDDQLTLTGIAEETARIFSLEYCSIHVYSEGRWHSVMGSAASGASDIPPEIATKLLLKDHPTNIMDILDESELGVRYMTIRQGTMPLALLAVKSMTLPTSAMGTMAYMIGVRLMHITKNQ